MWRRRCSIGRGWGCKRNIYLCREEKVNKLWPDEAEFYMHLYKHNVKLNGDVLLSCVSRRNSKHRLQRRQIKRKEIMNVRYKLNKNLIRKNRPDLIKSRPYY